MKLLTSTAIQGCTLNQLKFLDFVPQRLGINAALDQAVECLCQAYSSCLSRTTLSDGVKRMKALKALQTSLQDPDEALSDETLCAAVCFSWMEVNTITQHDSIYF